MAKKDTFQRALARAEHLCAAREYCEMDMADKLKNYDLSQDQLDEIMDHLKQQKFIDHNRYARAFVNDKYKFNAWGKMKIRAHLAAKNISDADINKALETITENEYESVIWQELTKKWEKLNEPDAYKKKGKLFRFAQSRGYDFELVQRFIDQHTSTF